MTYTNRINKIQCGLLPFLVAGALLFLGSNKALAEENFGNVVTYPNSGAMVMGQVTIDGEAAGAGDVVAIYVGEELRGKNAVVLYDGNAWFNVHTTTAGGDESATFKVYDNSTGVTYENTELSGLIQPDGVLGSFPEPFLINFNSFLPPSSGSVTISGTPTVGQTLTVSNNLADANGLGTITYQWRLDGSPISGETSSSYILKQADAGKSVTVTASYTDGQGQAKGLTSSATSLVVNVTGSFVSNIQAAQRSGTKLVDIHYDVGQSDGNAMSINVEVSDDGGATYAVPAQSFSGDVGGSIQPGAGKQIVWDAEADWNGNFSTNMRFRITATVSE